MSTNSIVEEIKKCMKKSRQQNSRPQNPRLQNSRQQNPLRYRRVGGSKKTHIVNPLSGRRILKNGRLAKYLKKNNIL